MLEHVNEHSPIPISGDIKNLNELTKSELKELYLRTKNDYVDEFNRSTKREVEITEKLARLNKLERENDLNKYLDRYAEMSAEVVLDAIWASPSLIVQLINNIKPYLKDWVETLIKINK